MAVTVRQQISARKRSTPRKLAWLIGNYILLVILAIFFLFPIVFMVVSSLKSNEEQLLSDLSSLKAFIPYGTIRWETIVACLRGCLSDSTCLIWSLSSP